MLGDFNDRLDGSITRRRRHRRTACSSTTARYADADAAPGRGDARESSYSWGATIDHIIVSDELAARVDEASIDVRREELLRAIPTSPTTVSDHFPVTLALR